MASSTNSHEFEQTLIVKGQGSMVCCSSWGQKSQKGLSDLTTETEMSATTPPTPKSQGIKTFRFPHLLNRALTWHKARLAR